MFFLAFVAPHMVAVVAWLAIRVRSLAVEVLRMVGRARNHHPVSAVLPGTPAALWARVPEHCFLLCPVAVECRRTSGSEGGGDLPAVVLAVDDLVVDPTTVVAILLLDQFLALVPGWIPIAEATLDLLAAPATP
jgi:hypothetical protein